jgi:hypothetical protein
MKPLSISVGEKNHPNVFRTGFKDRELGEEAGENDHQEDEDNGDVH